MTSRQRNLLVTGGAGFIGVNFVHYWNANHPRDVIVVLDALTYAGNRHSLANLDAGPGFRFVHGDIADTRLVQDMLRKHRVDTVVHFAAESHVDRSIDGPDVFIQTNVGGTHSLLKACRKVWIENGAQPQHRFHHVSTDEVYGSLGPDDPAFTEATPYAPNSPYAASKAASDHLVRAYSRTFGLDVTTTNCSNNYGPYHFPEKLIPLTIVNILEGRPVPVYGDGRQVRDWLHVHDHCRAIEMVLDRGRSGETYNVGGKAEVENLKLIRTLCAVIDQAFGQSCELAERYPRCPAADSKSSESLITHVADRPGHDRRYAIDSSKLEGELGYRTGTVLAEGLAATFRWYVTNERWWRAIMDGRYRDWIDSQYGGRT
jgi:dTDP-glucose 4,6-dehydratase